MKITDLKCAIIGNAPIVRITTDAGIDGYGQAEIFKPYLKPQVLFYRDLILGEDPTNVERVMLKIRKLGAFKPWGSAVSAIEVALWDIAGQAAGVPIYKRYSPSQSMCPGQRLAPRGSRCGQRHSGSLWAVVPR
jgi:L-alanine-DL-glutamate epimerase-like enolase superfamily enzyme